MSTKSSSSSTKKRPPPKKLSLECEVCKKIFTRADTFRDHMRIHTGERPFPCAFCGRRFNQKSALRVHKRIHTKEKTNNCQLCKQEFLRPEALRKHMFTHINDPVSSKQAKKTTIKCDICFKTFSEADKFKLHMKSHIDEEKYHCINCDKIFRKKYMFLAHDCNDQSVVTVTPRVRTIKPKSPTVKSEPKTVKPKTPEKTPAKKTCPKTSPYKMVEVMSSSMDDMIYECDMCVNTYTTIPDLNVHVFTHINMSKFHCVFCKFKSSSSADLISHIDWTHHDECCTGRLRVCKNCLDDSAKIPKYFFDGIAYNCCWCNENFSYSIKPTRSGIKNSSIPYKCLDCMDSFKNLDEFLTHVMRHE